MACEGLKIPTRLKYWEERDFKKIDKIGEGAFGRAYLAADKNNIRVVVKQAIDPKAYEDLCEEIRGLQVLKEMGLEDRCQLMGFYGACWAPPCLKGCTELDLCKLSPTIELEYIQGKNLFEVFDQHYRTKREFDYSVLKAILVDILKQLLCLHAVGIIHRDVKPENIIIDPTNNRTRLIDYGFLCSARPTDLIERCENSYKGTIQYTPPETWLKRLQQESDDIWALGLTMFHLRYLQRPTFATSSDATEYFKEITKRLTKGTELDKLIGDMLTLNSQARPTAEQALRRASDL